MAKNREKQRAHLKCGMTKEERLAKETEEAEEALREEKLDLKNYYGNKDLTPFMVSRRMSRKGQLLSDYLKAKRGW